MKNLELYESFTESLNEARTRKNLMHELLQIPEDKKISDVYKSGRKLAEELVEAIRKNNLVPEKEVQRKAASMLSFAGNWPNDPKNSIFDVALKHVKSLFFDFCLVTFFPHAPLKQIRKYCWMCSFLLY
jgi:peptide subunit release factor 1 (eRF1)